jgi:peptidoglycan/xylan/chitin deacetylase (PgdA/CDA1 family)
MAKLQTIVVSTSWDDGDRCDLRVAEMLAGHGLAGTFYIPIEPFRAGRELSAKQIQELAAGRFEIGGHTVSHRSLTELSGPEQAREISECKRVLEDCLGAEVKSFCYPNGRMSRETVRCIEQAGYKGARTTRMLRSSLEFSPFEMPTTLQAYPHGAQAYLRNSVKGKNLRGLIDFARHRREARDWVELGRALFDQVLENGGFWHLYGHSWELESLDLWSQLDELLGHVARRPGVRYVTNAGVHQLLPSHGQPAGSGSGV